MQETTIISVRVSKRVRAKIRRLGISPSKVLRKALEDEIKARMIKDVQAELAGHRKALARISLEEVLEDLRQDRAR